MNWDEYEIYDPGVFAPLNTLPRAEARAAFDKLMREKTQRIEILRRLMSANGVHLSRTDEGIQDLNDWFRATIEPDPAKPGRLLPDWYSVVNDIALFLGEVITERCPGLRWQFFTWGKKDVAYQHHVLMGFRVPNPKFNMDIDARVAGYGHRIVASRGSIPHYGTVVVRGVEIDVDAVTAQTRDRPIEEDAFWRWVKWAESSA
jgi:hypothetical protein